MKRKGRFRLVIALLVLCSLTGCGSGARTAGGSGAGAHASVKGDLALLTTGSTYQDCGTDYGYYYLSEDRRHLMYIDYAGKQEVYLCNSPGCKHDTQACTSYINEEEYQTGNSLFYYQGYLYLFSHDYDDDGSTSVVFESDEGISVDDTLASAPAALYRMKPDGTEREKVFTFEKGMTLEDTVLYDDSGLYFIMKKLQNEKLDAQTTKTTAVDRQLIRVDTDRWDAEKICELTLDGGITACYDNKLVISYLQYDHALTEQEMEDDDKMREALLASESVYILFDMRTGEKEELYRCKNNKLHQVLIKDQFLYTAQEGEDKIWKYDMKTGEKQLLCETKCNNLMDIYEDVLYCWSWQSDENGEMTDQNLYFVHTAFSPRLII